MWHLEQIRDGLWRVYCDSIAVADITYNGSRYEVEHAGSFHHQNNAYKYVINKCEGIR